MDKKDVVRRTIALDSETNNKIVALAEAHTRPINYEIAVAIKEYIQRQEGKET